MAYSTISKPSLHFNTLLYSGDGTNVKFQTGLRTKLRQLRIMKAIQSARKSGGNDLGKMLAKLKFMASKQGFGGGREKGGYYKLQ